MDELQRQLKIFILFLICVSVVVIVYKSDYFWNIAKGLPLHTNSGKCQPINDNLCLAEDAGLRVGYYEASSLCSKRNMRLPNLEDAWYIWTSSENCHRIFAANELIPVDKNAFVTNNRSQTSIVPANKIKKYCSDSPVMKFSTSSQYKHGSYWLKDNAGDGKHYAINFNTGKVLPYSDTDKNLGVRCVSQK